MNGNGNGSPISASRILKDLDALWISLSQSQESDAQHPNTAVLRACAMTLIAVVEGDGSDLGETLAMLVREHPSRLILLTVQPGPDALLEAGVTAQCWMPFGKRQQICCEQIVLNASRPSLGEIPPVIRGLIVPDLPVACWVRTRDLALAPELGGVIDLADKLILDSGGVTDLARQVDFIRTTGTATRRVGDLAWTRLTRWREAIAQLFDDEGGAERARAVERARIEYQGEYVPISAYYLAAWLRNSLGRPLPVEIVQCAGPAERARVMRVALSDGAVDASITVSQDRDVELHAGKRDAHTVFPRRTEYELLCEELAILGTDPTYEAAMTAMPELTRGGAPAR